MDDWKTEAETLLREIARDDVGDSPVYLVDAREVREYEPQLCGPSICAGWTSPICDLMCSDWLKTNGRWQGRGFACVVHPDRFESRQHLLGGILHEFSHGLENGLPTTRGVSRGDQVWADHLQGALKLRSHFRAEMKTQRIAPWNQHEAGFIRAAAHLAHRAGQVTESIRPRHLSFASPYHQAPFSESCWMTALGDELARCGSIRGILAEPPPEAFTSRWADATDWFNTETSCD